MLTAVKDEQTNSPHISPDVFLVKNHHLIPNNRVLISNDCTCNNSIYLAKLGFDVTTLCPTQYAVRKSRQITKQSKTSVNYLCSDLNNFNLEKDNWDAIITLFCHMSPISRQSFHHRLSHTLRHKGIYFTESCIQTHMNSAENIDASTIRKELCQLQIIHIHELEKEITVNIKTSHKAQVIQAMAVK